MVGVRQSFGKKKVTPKVKQPIGSGLLGMGAAGSGAAEVLATKADTWLSKL